MCIRAGQFDSRTTRTRKLGSFDRAIAVGRGYYADRPKVDHPKQLKNWDWVNYRHNKRTYQLTSPIGEIAKLVIKDEARLQVDNIETLYAFTCMNAGVAAMPLLTWRDQAARPA
ncbi:MAG: LysR substrate-binding domain-containing protein [Parasphingorhabdus sp.]|uniref:LysR substrate-binding domain-containing protein n=1 Tax=Parasphingorhabdus sp. TaxID=2709688 RepID=UPI003299AFEF